jgi:hypothetical protein
LKIIIIAIITRYKKNTMTIYNRINNYLISIYYKVFQMNNLTSQKKTIHLGRWNINDTNKTNIKIDYANEDHCGTCLIIKTNKTDIK